MLRKFIVKNFVMYKNFKLFGKTYNLLRASRIMFPSFIFAALISVIVNILWVNLIILSYLLILIWVGFDLYGLGYFKLFPVKWEELDKEQKYQWGSISGSLTEEQFEEWVKIVKEIQFK